MASLMDSSIDVDSIPASDLDLSIAVASICNEADEAVRQERAVRFVALAKRDFEQRPSTSSDGPRSASSEGDEAGEVLVDVLWAFDQTFDPVQDAVAGGLVNGRSILGQLVKELHAAGVYHADFLKQRLDFQLLEAAGLLSAAAVQQWTKQEPRIKTSLLYKQQKFNLLREETEGYSKLEVELLANMGPPHEAKTARPAEPLVNIRKRASKTVENIKGLIGYFDLDPIRTLDIILDVFADNVLYHHVFFRELLKASPWAPKKELAQANGYHTESLLPDGSMGSSTTGSSVCAQILGFKFAWYNTPEGASEAPSEKLYLLAAILIFDGFVDLACLWPHLHPSDDEGMNKLKDKFKDDISDRIMAAKANALSMTGVLADDGPPSLPQRPTGPISIAGSAAKAAGEAAPATEKVSDPPNTRVGLLRGLLSVGAIEPAFFILSKYSWICEPHPDLADLLLRISNFAIADFYKSRASSFSATLDDAKNKQSSLAQARPRYSIAEKKLGPAPSTQVYITGRPIDVPKITDRAWRETVYFFPEWKDHLPTVDSSGELFELVSQMFKLVGVHAGRNKEFLSRLMRLVKLDSAVDGPARKQWEGIIRLNLIPAVALSEPSPATTLELWDILRNYPHITRFSFYGEWKDRSYKRMPELRVKKAEAERDAKGLLKRLSVDNVKQFGRSLAKIAHTNPAVLFEIALNQVQSYDNLIGPVVESARYLTPLGYDVLAYSLLDALSNPEKERTKTDGTNISLWLQSLATFSGTLCRRWNMDVSYILQYILNQLLEGNPKDLIVLRELISKMTGVEPVSDLSDSQVVALGGGRTLQSEALNPTTAVEKKNATKRSSLRLKVALQDSSLAVPLLVAVAVQRQECVFGNEDAPLKYLGNLFDQCQQVLFQYLDFLSSNFGPEQFSKMVPDLQDLWIQHGIDAGVAFQIVRPSLQLAIQKANEAGKSAQQDAMARLKEELKASRAAKLAKIEVSESGNEAPRAEAAVGAVDVKMEEAEKPVGETASTSQPSPWHPALVSCVAVAAQQLPASTQSVMSAGFFVTFWQLSLYDVFVPMARYQAEVDRLNGLIREIDGALKSTLPNYPGHLVDKAAEAEKKSTRERLLGQVNALNADLKAHTEAYDATRKRLAAEKAHWFLVDSGDKPMSSKEASANRRLAVQHFLQECLIPRARLSPIDASYAARLVRLLHNSATPNFPSLHVYDRIFSEDLPAIVFSSTEGEARNYARFLHDSLSDLSAWYKDVNQYSKHAIGKDLPGFQKVWGTRKAGDPIPEGDFLKYNDFKLITHKWHKNMTSSFEACITTGEYMAIRNSILIMTKLAAFYPILERDRKVLDTVIASLIASEKREDLKVLALGYSALLKKQAPNMLPLGAALAKTTRTASQPPVPATTAQTVNSPAVKAEKTEAVAPKSESDSTKQHLAAPNNALPTGPRSSVPAPLPRPAGLPARPVSEVERRRKESNNSNASVSSRPPLDTSRRTSELSVPSVPRTSHALPARPGSSQEMGRREPSGSQQRPSGRGNSPTPAASRPPTPTTSKHVDSMEVDEPQTTPKQGGESAAVKEEFAKPARPSSPAGSRASASRAGSPRPREGESPRTSRKDGEESSREDRTSRRDESDRTHRRSRANSAESSHSSHRDRRERKDSGKLSTTEKSEREDRKGRERRSDRDREKDRDKDRSGEKRDRSDRDKERSHRDRKDRDDGRSRDSRRESSRKDSDRRDRDKDRDKDRESRDKDKEPRDKDKESRKDSERRSSRRDDRDKSDRDGKRSDSKEDRTRKSENDSAVKTSVEVAQDSPKPQLKRAADSNTSLADQAAQPPGQDGHADKRRKTDEPALPSGPKADRRQPPPLSSLPARAVPSGGTTSIKGRAASSATPDTATGGSSQGLRIKSAASVASALSSAHQHNARQDRSTSSRGGTPAADQGSSKPTDSPAADTSRSERQRPSDIKVDEGKPRGLFERLGNSDSQSPKPANGGRPDNERDRRRRGGRVTR